MDFSAITTFVSHPSPGAAVAMVPPVIAVPAARHDLESHSSGQPQNPAEKVGYDGRPRGAGGVLKAPLETSFAEHDASHAGIGVAHAALAGPTRSAPATPPRSAFTVSVENLAAAAEARSSPFTAESDQAYMMILVDGGRLLIPVTGGLSLAEAVEASAARDAEHAAASAKAEEAAKNAATQRPSGASLADSGYRNGINENHALPAEGGVGNRLGASTDHGFVVNRMLQDRLMDAASAIPPAGVSFGGSGMTSGMADTSNAQASAGVLQASSAPVRGSTGELDASPLGLPKQDRKVDAVKVGSAHPLQHKAHGVYRQVADTKGA